MVDFARLAEARAGYVTEQPLFEAVAARVAAILESDCRAAGVYCRVEHRAKDPRSLIKKLMANPRLQFATLQDKAGVRVIPARLSHVAKTAEFVRERFEVASESDAAERLRPHQFGYRSVHIIVRVGGSGDPECPEEQVGKVCEVQIRTESQHLWSSASHELEYKSDTGASPETSRSLARLAALLELVDIELERLRSDMTVADDDQRSEIAHYLADVHWRLGGIPGRTDITRSVVGMLLPALDQSTGGHWRAELESFVQENEGLLEKKLHDYRDEIENVLLAQPEAILVFFLLQRRWDFLRARWPEELPEVWRERFEAVWPPPDP